VDRVGQVIARDDGDGVRFEPDPGGSVTGVVGREDHVDHPVGIGGRLTVVAAPDDALGVTAVVGTAVDGQGEVDGVAARDPHAVRPRRVDRGEEIEGVRVVPAPFLVGPDDLGEAGARRVRPYLRVGGHLQDRQQPLVRFKKALLVAGP
jgi:hypothetical protein